MVRMLEWLAVAMIGALLASAPGERAQVQGIGPLDASGGFFHPEFVSKPDTVLAETTTGTITAGTYLRYLAGRSGTRFLPDLAFDELLVRECRARRLAGNAPLLARSLATRRFHESGRAAADDPDGSVRRKFANEALRQFRIDALVGERRVREGKLVRGLFERRYGVDGQRVTVRQLLVSLTGTRRRLEEAGKPVTEDAVRLAARSRVEALHRRVVDGTGFDQLLGESDDRNTRRLLRDPDQKERAGIVEGYNFRRYGEAFAAAVRGLGVGQISAPVASDVGYHVVQLLHRKVTRFEDVSAGLEREIRGKTASPADVSALRRELLDRYRFRRKS